MLIDGINHGTIDYVDGSVKQNDLTFSSVGRKNYLINAYIIKNAYGCSIGHSTTEANGHYWGSDCTFDAEL